jgi:acyl dehydratase
MGRAFEDLPAGTRLQSITQLITGDAMTKFAREFDPQLFHLDGRAAGRTIFNGLAASGWHTAAVTMRLFVETMDVPGGIIGLAVDDLRWPNAVRPGDELRLEIEILEARRSRSRAGYGIIRLRNVTKNQRGEIVQSFVASAMIPNRAETERIIS